MPSKSTALPAGAAPFLTPAEVATRLGVSVKTVLRLVAQRRMSAIIIGRQLIRFRPEMVDAFIEAQVVVAEAPSSIPLRQKRPVTFIDRFWRYVDKSGECWLWTGATNGRYGHISRGTGLGLVGSHRASWEIHNGPIPPGMHVCHHCDTPPCVRPDHLFLGTNQDNTNDKVAKGRHLRKQK